MVEEKNVKRGKAAKAAGTRFENKVGNHMRSLGYFVDKWNNNVEFPEENIELPPEERTGKLIIAKGKFNPFSKAVMIGAGFPDFIAFKRIDHIQLHRGDGTQIYIGHHKLTETIGVEAKMNGFLTQIEKEKCQWLLEEGVFSEIWIASVGEKRGEILYRDFTKIKFNKVKTEDGN